MLDHFPTSETTKTTTTNNKQEQERAQLFGEFSERVGIVRERILYRWQKQRQGQE